MKYLIQVLCTALLLAGLFSQPALSSARYVRGTFPAFHSSTIDSVIHKFRPQVRGFRAALNINRGKQKLPPPVEGIEPNPFATVAAVAAATGLLAVAVSGIFSISSLLLLGAITGLVATICGALGLGKTRKNRWLAGLAMGIGIGLLMGCTIGYLLDISGWNF